MEPGWSQGGVRVKSGWSQVAIRAGSGLNQGDSCHDVIMSPNSFPVNIIYYMFVLGTYGWFHC